MSAGEVAATVLGALAGAAVVALLLVLALALRRRALTRVRGTFEVCVRRRDGRWVLGVGRYGADRVAWWRVLSLHPRPVGSWRRADLVVRQRRCPTAAEVPLVPPGAVVVRVEHAGDSLELAMSEDACTGLASWLEGAPPGAGVRA